ncbi:MAG: ribonuclease P protein component [Clostridia bacterium]
MIKKEYRLKKNYEFSYLYKKGEKLFSKEVTLIYVKNKNNHKKIGISVSKKIGNAVVRSRYKRKLREAINLHINNLSDSFNYLLIAREDIINASFKEIYFSVTKLLKKGNLINE